MSLWKFWERDADEQSPDYYAEGVQLARNERYHEALTSFRLALRERPDDVAALEQMAVVYTRIGMTDEAIKTYRRTLQKHPESPGANYGIAYLLLNRGRREEAADHLRTFLEEASDDEETRRHVEHARETLERLASPGEESS